MSLQQYALGMAAAMGLLVAGCSGLHSSEATMVTYSLRSTASAVGTGAGDGVNAIAVARPMAALQVLLPRMQPGLDSDRIALASADHRLDYFAASRWSDTLPLVIEAALVESLRGGGRFLAVHDSVAPFHADYVLQVDVRNFEAQYAGAASTGSIAAASSAPTAVVRLECTLGRRLDRSLISTFVVESRIAADANRVTAIVDALAGASQSAFREVDAKANAAIATAQLPPTPLPR